jgi:hypothetical protein
VQDNSIENAEGTPAAAAPSLPYAGVTSPNESTELSALPSRYDVAVVAVRMLGLYVLLQGAFAISWAVVSVFDALRGGISAVLVASAGVIPLAVCAVLGLYLIKAAPGVAARMLPKSRVHGDVEAPAAGSASLQAVAFSVAGAVIVVQAIPNFFFQLVGTFRQLGNVYAVRNSGDLF